MSTETDAGIKPERDYWKEYNMWCKKNWFTMVAIIIVLLGLWIELATVEVQKVKAVRQCNDFWIEQTKASCPALFFGNNKPYFNLSDS